MIEAYEAKHGKKAEKVNLKDHKTIKINYVLYHCVKNYFFYWHLILIAFLLVEFLRYFI